MSWKCQPPACASFTPFSGNMDLMVSQVRRSVVSVVQQYSHIRYLRLLVDPLSPGLMYYIKMSSLNFPSDHTCKKKNKKNTVSVFNEVLLVSPSVVCTCVATLLGLIWLRWFSPLTGRSTLSPLRSKVRPIMWIEWYMWQSLAWLWVTAYGNILKHMLRQYSVET